MQERNNILISGYAKLPANTTAEAVYNMLAVVVCFDKRSGIIQQAEVTVVTGLARDFVADLMIGYNLNDGPDALIELFDSTYYGHAKRAMETAIRTVFAKYNDLHFQDQIRN